MAAGLSVAEGARIAVFAPRSDSDLSAFAADQCHIITGFRPDRDHFAAQGYACNTAPEGRYGAALVILPRAKALARGLVALAESVTDGPLVIDGAKTDGIESVLKEARKRGAISGQISKAHGKLFWLLPQADADGDAGAQNARFADWALPESQIIEGGYHTAPGVFSADAIDPASKLLAGALPDKLGAHIADLGAGWGYLSAQVLSRDSVKTVHLVEADHAALDCAQRNVTDARAQFHWADATQWTPPKDASAPRIDTVVMNPPFHSGRRAEPELGRAFIAQAARILAQSGHLWMVANRHLPYEEALNAGFAHVEEVAGDNRFKVLHAQRPKARSRT